MDIQKTNRSCKEVEMTEYYLFRCDCTHIWTSTEKERQCSQCGARIQGVILDE